MRNNNPEYYKNTRAEFKPVPVAEATAIMFEYFDYRRKRNKPEFISVAGFGENHVAGFPLLLA